MNVKIITVTYSRGLSFSKKYATVRSLNATDINNLIVKITKTDAKNDMIKPVNIRFLENRSFLNMLSNDMNMKVFVK